MNSLKSQPQVWQLSGSSLHDIVTLPLTGNWLSLYILFYLTSILLSASNHRRLVTDKVRTNHICNMNMLQLRLIITLLVNVSVWWVSPWSFYLSLCTLRSMVGSRFWCIRYGAKLGIWLHRFCEANGLAIFVRVTSRRLWGIILIGISFRKNVAWSIITTQHSTKEIAWTIDDLMICRWFFDDNCLNLCAF